MITLIELEPLDKTTGARKFLRATSHNTEQGTAFGGEAWQPAISSFPQVAIKLFKGEFDGAALPTAGSLSVEIDKFLSEQPLARSFVWQGAPLRIRSGETGDVWPWPIRFEGRVTGWSASGNAVNLNIAVNTEPFEVNVLTIAYLGTGGKEGGLDLKDKFKPFLSGRCFNAEPVRINEVDSVFQFHGYGPMQGVSFLYENGSDFGASVGDYATYALLIVATIPPGRWATCLSEGIVRLGAPPAGVITGDVDGDKPTGIWLRKTGEILLRIASNSAVSASLIEAASFASIDAGFSGLPNQGRIGKYITEQTTVIVLAAEMLAPCLAYVGVSLIGKMFASAVAIGVPALTLDAQQRQEPRVLSSQETSTLPPFSYVEMGYAQSWRVHTLDEISSNVTLIPRGLHSLTETYREGNIVSTMTGGEYQYINIVASAGNPLTDTLYWTEITPASHDAGATNNGNPSILTIAQKIDLSAREANRENLYQTLQTRAVAHQVRGFTVTEMATATSARLAQVTYLGTITPAWNSTSATSPIVRATFDASDLAYENALNGLYRRISEIDALTATVGGGGLIDSAGNHIGVDNIRNNLALADWWRKAAPQPWLRAPGYNEIISTNDLAGGLVGARGYPEDVWYASQSVANGDYGGGWFAAANTAPLDPTKTYRFVQLVRVIATGGFTLFGPSPNVCDLNTATINNNPYFTGFDADLTGGRWRLFVGYIFPAGSYNQGNGGAGVWDCRTGLKLTAGTNYCFAAGVGNVHHRASQYAANANDVRLFERPIVNLVDGTEPPLDTYFEDGARLNAAITVNGSGNFVNLAAGITGVAVANSLLNPSITAAADAAAAADALAVAAQTSANAANTSIANISSDSLLTPDEKPSVIKDRDAILAEQAGIDAQAADYSITTERTAYNSAVTALTNYLATLTTPVLWSALGGNTTIVGTTFRTRFLDVYAARSTLLNRISAIAGTLANWTNIVGQPSAPDSNATVSDNIIRNADMQSDTSQWNMLGTSRVPAGSGTAPGNFFIEFLQGALRYAQFNNANRLPVGGATKLHFSCYVFINAGGTGTFAVEFSWFNALGAASAIPSLTFDLVSGTTTNVWTLKTFEIEVPSDAASFKAGFASNRVTQPANVIGPRLSRTAIGADVTAMVTPQHDIATSITFFADFMNILKDQEVNRVINCQRLRGAVNVTTTSAWSLIAVGCTAAIGAATGIITFSAVATNGYIDVTSTRVGEAPLYTRITVNKIADNPPFVSGAGATSASTSSLSAVTASAYGAAATPTMTVRVGSAGIVNLTCPMNFKGLPFTGGVASNTLLAKWQWKTTVAGTWADVAAEISSATAPGFDAIRSYNFGDAVFENNDGYTQITMQKTGLTNGVDYDFQLLARRSAGTLSTTMIGTATAVAS